MSVFPRRLTVTLDVFKLYAATFTQKCFPWLTVTLDVFKYYFCI